MRSRKAIARGGIAQIFAPRLEVDVRGQRRGTLAAAGIDDLVEEVRCLGTLAAFDAVEAELVDDDQVETRPVADAAGQGLVGQRLSQVVQQIGTGGVTHAVAQFAVAAAQRLEEMALSHAALADHHEVLVAAEELAGGQLLDLGAVDRRGVELPVEVLQSLSSRNLASRIRRSIGPLTAACRRFPQDQFQEVQVGQSLLFGARKRRVEDLGGERKLERLGVVQEPVRED